MPEEELELAMIEAAPEPAVDTEEVMEPAEPMLDVLTLVTSRLPTLLLPLPVSVSVPEHSPELELLLLELEELLLQLAELLLLVLTSVSSRTDEDEVSSLSTLFRLMLALPLAAPHDSSTASTTVATGSSKVLAIVLLQG